MPRRELFPCPHCGSLMFPPRGMTGPTHPACGAHCGIPLIDKGVHICPYCSMLIHWSAKRRGVTQANVDVLHILSRHGLKLAASFVRDKRRVLKKRARRS